MSKVYIDHTATMAQWTRIHAEAEYVHLPNESRESGNEYAGVMPQMILYERGNEIITVVIAVMAP